MMRGVCVLLGGLAASLAVSLGSSSHAQEPADVTWSNPIEISLPSRWPLGVHAFADRLVTVSQRRRSLVIDTFVDGVRTRRWRGRHVEGLLSFARPVGEVAVLVRGRARARRQARLRFLGVGRDGSARQVRGARMRPGVLAAAASGSRIAVASIERRRGRARLRLVTSDDGRRFRWPHVVRGALPSVRSSAIVTDLELAFGPAGDLVFAAAFWGRRSKLVLGSLTPTGRLLVRQVAPDVTGDVQLQVTSGGRLGLLVEDIGGAPDDSECIDDAGTGRRVWATVREPDATRFRPTQLLARSHFECGWVNATLAAAPDDRLAILWDVGVSGHSRSDPAVVRISEAPAGQAFGRPATAWTGYALEAAFFDSAGGLITALTRLRDDVPGTRVGSLVVQRRRPDGSLGAEHALSENGAEVLVAQLDAAGSPTLAWKAGSRRLRLSRGSLR